jgi:hypothetical protein
MKHCPIAEVSVCAHAATSAGSACIPARATRPYDVLPGHEPR